jgi:UDP-N-acetylmuramate dehydrogenase
MPEIQENVLLSEKTKSGYGIGGSADYYLLIQNAEDVEFAVNFAKNKKIPFFVLGNGSNILVSDKGFRGIVIDTRRMSAVQVFENTIRAESGTQITALVQEAVSANFSGLEGLSGIPGTVGGGIVMNAGAYSQTISDCITQICYYDCDLDKIVTISKEEAEFEYRSSIFQRRNYIILWADFAFSLKVSYGILVSRQNEVLRKRKESQPLEYHSCGSVFKRPPDSFAGKLIEQSGLKGFSIGGAQVSKKHASFIVNNNNASAEDVRKIIAEIRKVVNKKFSTLLEPEVIFLGEFETEI